MMNGAAALVFDNIVKDYPGGLLRRRTLRAVDQVSFRVERGEVVGLIGPNRAGKTTLVKLLLALCQPTAGRVERLGKPGDARHTLARVGYVHENQAFPPYLSAAALLEYYGALSWIPEATVKQRVPILLNRVGLIDRAAEPISRFSKGMKQRLAIAQAFLNEPELVVLDEPGEGLDLDGRQLLRSLIAEHKAAGRTVLYVSHLLNEVEQLCDRLAVLVGGRLVFLGPLVELTRGRPGGTPTLEQSLQRLYRDNSHVLPRNDAVSSSRASHSP